VRILLSPSRSRRREWFVFRSARGYDLAITTDENGARAASTNVNSKEFGCHAGNFQERKQGLLRESE
jgi:hypothetical protein